MISPIPSRSNPPSASATNYIGLSGQYNFNPNATEVNVSSVMPNSGILQNFYVNNNTAPGAGTSLAYTVMKNGVATSMTCTIANTAVNGSDTVNIVPYAQGDTISIQTVPTGTPVVDMFSTF